ncbi:MAG: hypothetical protein QW641_01435 [Candidatus Aenigmatarchaeota archaeon]
MKIKGQAAMEFLMTYGIAILIIVSVIVALYAMGVFRIGRGGPSCSPCFPAGTEFQYKDHSRDALVLANGPYELEIRNVYKGGSNITANCSAFTNPYPPNSDITLRCRGQFAGDVTITIEYNRTIDVFKSVTATLHGA